MATNNLLESWPKKISELADLLGTSRTRIENFRSDNKDEFIEGKDFNWGIKRGSPRFLLWNESGAIKIAQHLPTEKAADFLEIKGIKAKQKIREEHHYLDIIIAALKDITRCEKSFPTGHYKIDLYLPDLKLAIECDERGHEIGYDKTKEKNREIFIKTKLNCEIKRFNPNQTGFNIGEIINCIFLNFINTVKEDVGTSLSSPPKTEKPG